MLSRIFIYPAEIILFIYLICFLFLKTSDNPWERAIDSDGKGYYAYLPAIFIYHDLKYNFVESYEKKYYPEDGSRFKDFRYKYKGETVNKTFSGLAILWLPFFLIAHLLSYIFGFETDGYSVIYQYSIAIAAIFYLWLGCKILLGVLKRFANQSVSSFIVLCFAFGTNLFYFTINVPSFAHVYNFSLIASFIYCIIVTIETKKRKWFILSAVVYTLIVAVRPPNGIIILIVPFLVKDWQGLKLFILENVLVVKKILPALFLGTIILFIPVTLWYLQTGYFLVYSYGEESFDFSKPEITNNLFSYRKGLFVYTPLAFISLFGLIPVLRKRKFQFLALGLFLIFIIYVISSWWCWWYGASFGQRAYIDYFPIFAIVLGFLLTYASTNKFFKIFLFTCCILTIPLNLIQSYQHKKGIVPDDNVTQEIYWDNFLRMKPRPKVYIDENTFLKKNELIQDMEGCNSKTDSISFEGKSSSFINSKTEFSCGIEKSISEFTTDNASLIKISAEIFPLGSSTKARLVVQIDSAGIVYDYNAFGFNEYAEENRWTHVQFSCNIPRPKSENDFIKIYLWNSGKEDVVYIDNLKAEFYEKKK